MDRLTSKQLEELLDLQKFKYVTDYKVEFEEWADKSIFLGMSVGRYYEHDGMNYDPKAEYLNTQDWDRVKITKTKEWLDNVKKEEAHKMHIKYVKETINTLVFSLEDIAEALGLYTSDDLGYDYE